jgi:enamine deaminase RidA (YjgF/YER057c/UK114 family)
MPDAKPRFIAGQTAFDAQGNVVGVGDFRAQAEQTYRNLKVTLDAVGAGPEDIVKVTNYVLDRANLPLLVEVDAIVALPRG